MASFHDLPPEILQQIIFFIFINAQVTTSESEIPYFPECYLNFFEDEGREESFAALRYHSLRKALSGSFIEDLEATHSCKGIGGAGLYNFQYDLYCCLCNNRIARADLLALSMTSKALNSLAQPFIWKVIELGQADKKGAMDVEGVLCSVLKTPALGRLIRSMSFRNAWIDDDVEFGKELLPEIEQLTHVFVKLSMYNSSSTEAEIRSFAKQFTTWGQWAMLLFILPNLENVKIRGNLNPTFSKSFFDDSPARIRELFTRTGLGKIREFSLIIEDPDSDVYLDSHEVFPPFLLPSVQTLYFGLVFIDRIEGDIEQWKQYHGTSTVTTLAFDHAMLSADVCTELIKFPKRLESFKFSFAGPSNRYPCVEAAEICRQLLPHRATLKGLDIREYPLFRERDQDQIGSIISEFLVLEDVGILATFIQTIGLANSFPQSIVRLKLYMYDEWSLESCRLEMHRMLGAKQQGLVYPHLEEIWIEFWELTESEQQQYSCYEEWERNHDEMIESMIIFGDTLGVSVTVDVQKNCQSDL